MRTKILFFLRTISLLVLVVSFVPVNTAQALPPAAPPPVDMFQLPWDLGKAWVAIDGIDNGSKRPASSSHNHRLGGAIDFAPKSTMITGENTSNYWVTAAAAGTVIETSSCYLTIAHGDGWLTQYQFLGNIQVNLGDVVSRNQRLGIIADGIKYKYCPGFQEINVPHLHFMLRPSTIGATFAGWEVKYNSLFNRTTFTKGLITVGLFKPLLNVFDSPATPTPTTQLTNTPDLTPSSTPTPEMSATPTLFGPYVSTTVDLPSIDVGETASVTVSLHNVPAEGYTSAEFTCHYTAFYVEVSDILVTDLFGADAAVAINGPQNNSFIVAIAGSNGSKATTSGTVFTFKVKGLQIGQTNLGCEARVSQGNDALTQIPSANTSLTVLGDATSTPTPNLTPSTSTVLPSTCDKAEFIADITIPPGTVMSPGAQFTKTWRLKNLGPCVWTTSYSLVYFSGEMMGAPSSVALPQSVAVGQTVDVTLNMIAPNATGSHRGYWMFRNSTGANFGLGPDATQPWFVDILVAGPTLPPSLTPTRPPSSATPTLPVTACDKAQFVADITIPDGTIFAPGATFTKTWRLKNIGTCTWTTSYQLVFFSGEQMGAPSSASFPINVAPGQTADFSLNMIAPNATGPHRGYWMFKNSSGALFGIGAQGNHPWWMEIRVSDGSLTPGPTFTPSPSPLTPSPTGSEPATSATPSPTLGNPANSPTPTITPGEPAATPSETPQGPPPTPVTGIAYDFAANMCAATWLSGAGQLPCPGIDGDAKGFVLRLNNPKLETGQLDARPGLLTFPQNTQNGYIQGFYPPFHVQNGDRFRSLLNCEFGATNCYVAFRLDYQVGADPIKTLWGPFLERYEGQYFSVDVDLSSLAGKDVKFILTVLSAGQATGDRALWVGPIIHRASSAATSTPTADVSPSPTATLPGGDWLTFTNSKYGFRFLYPSAGQIVDGGNENSTRINLPFVPGTNLSQKYLQMTVAENVNPCRSPLASSSIPQTSETLVINGTTFLKETGEDGTAGHINKWTAYSTLRDNACVSLDFVLRAANPGVFTTPPPLYDEVAESAVFGQIVSTYEWLGVATATPTTEPPVTPVGSATATGLPDGALTGQVLASKSITVSLYTATNILVTSVTANPDGTFSLSAPGGTYTVRASASGFLSAEGPATIPGGGSSAKATITLLAGDLDGNDMIDQFDALTIGMNYNETTPSAADLNNDGVINVLDLERLAGSYRETGPLAWE